jgi:hypothetical protein
MENVLSFLTSLDDDEVINMIIFLKTYIECKTSQKGAERKLLKLAKIRTMLRESGHSEKDIERICISKMLELGFITAEEAEDRIECLNRAVF